MSFKRRADVETLSSELNVPQIRLYPVLKTLEKRSHVECNGSEVVFLGEAIPSG